MTLEKKITAAVNLFVRAPPIISDKLSTISQKPVREGKQVELKCEAIAFPKANITWFRPKLGLLPDGQNNFK